MRLFAQTVHAAATRPAHACLAHGTSASSPLDSRDLCPVGLAGALLYAIVAVGLLAPGVAHSEPIVSGCEVHVHAAVPNPQSLAFAPDGTIYAGHDSHQGDTHADPVFRIGPGGAPITEYGTQSFFDPDGVLHDPDGSTTGVAGGVLVSDWSAGMGASALRLIHPDESVTTWAAPGQAIKNPTYLVADSSGAVWLTDDYRYQTGLVRVTDGMAQVMAAGPAYGFWGIALSPSGTLYVSANVDGTNKTIREYDLDGNLIQADFATSPSYDLLAFGCGGAFGSDLFVMSLQGDLFRLDTGGAATQIGSGFQTPVDLKFGPDGSLYVSEDVPGRILRITPDASSIPPWADAPSSGRNTVSVFPNPSRGSVDVRLALEGAQPEVVVDVFDVAGRLVRRLHAGPLATGRHTISWNGLDASGRRCETAIYFVRVCGQGIQLRARLVRVN